MNDKNKNRERAALALATDPDAEAVGAARALAIIGRSYTGEGSGELLADWARVLVLLLDGEFYGLDVLLLQHVECNGDSWDIEAMQRVLARVRAARAK